MRVVILHILERRLVGIILFHSMPIMWVNVHSIEFGGSSLVKAAVLDVFPKTLIHGCFHRLVVKSLVDGSALRLILFRQLI